MAATYAWGSDAQHYSVFYAWAEETIPSWCLPSDKWCRQAEFLFFFRPAAARRLLASRPEHGFNGRQNPPFPSCRAEGSVMLRPLGSAGLPRRARWIMAALALVTLT